MPIDSIYDFSDKALVELKSWLEPWFLTRDVDAAAAGGSGFQFHTGTYGADNVGDWSIIETTGRVGSNFSQPASVVLDAATNYGFAINAGPSGMLVVGDPTVSPHFNGIFVVEAGMNVDVSADPVFIGMSYTGAGGGNGITIDASAQTGLIDGLDIAITTTTGRVRGANIAVNRTASTTADVIALQLSAGASGGGSGLAYAIKTTAGLVTLGALPTSSAGLPTGTLWNNSGVVNVA